METYYIETVCYTHVMITPVEIHGLQV